MSAGQADSECQIKPRLVTGAGLCARYADDALLCPHPPCVDGGRSWHCPMLASSWVSWRLHCSWEATAMES